MDSPSSKALLVILDGYGIAEHPEVSAIDRADTPFLDHLFVSAPHARLSASGTDVGLPEGQFGNSEVGHLNIGAGRIVWQELSRINRAIADGTFYRNEVLVNAMEKASERGRLHIMGLFSEGGVHSHNDHLFALLELARRHEVDRALVHAFTDGRDTAPRAGADYMRTFQQRSREIGLGTIASIVGRYFAMDRDERWDRTRAAYDLLVRGNGEPFEDPAEALEHRYASGETDEFIRPMVRAGLEDGRIREGDVVVFYNIRGDRARQLTRAFLQENLEAFPAEDLKPHYCTFTRYDDDFEKAQVAFPPAAIPNTLGETVSRRHLRQLRIAETEKYAHVTYFFNGGEEDPYQGEERILIPSPHVATYDLKPEMSAPEVADALCSQLITEKHHLAVLNFANPDMVGHTGVMEAAVRAVETVDTQLEKVVTAAREHGYKVLIIADHGNADCMVQEDGSPHTAHTCAPVPVLLLGEGEGTRLRDGILADVAPTLLKMMGLEAPAEMTGKPLF
ncbi:MAG: 2,3-bisphosphoglycerate-independent phosphoglycerate mutase [Balneolaceae bacterium]|nr:2,3-bisphosphoglycerate-independent phosphoglycerate mutase [Balneolaceae bacterium]